MKAGVRWILVLGVLALGSAGALAGDAADKPLPKGAEFDRLFGQWKEIMGQLVRLRGEYRRAPPAGRDAIQARYDELLKEGDAMLLSLRAAAEAAFLESPDPDSYPAEFLVATIVRDCDRDAYEPAYRTTKLLLEHGFDQKPIYGAAGIAAFAVGDFESAKKWLLIANENNVFARYESPWKEIGPSALKACDSCEQSWKKEQAIRDAESKADKSPETWLPRVLLHTTKGDIELELFENEAPNTVANFVALVESGAYTADPAHRLESAIPFYNVAKARGAETGGYIGPDGKVYSKLLYGCDEPKRPHFRGSVTMTQPADGQGGGTWQFSILFFPLQSLNGKNTCFGRVVRGMEVLSQLQRIDPEHFDVLEPDKILDAKVLRKRNHVYTLRAPSAATPGPEPAAKPGPKPAATPGPKPAAKPKPLDK